MNAPKPYPSYRPSGVPWLGDVPVHWEVWRGKAILRPVDVRSETGDEELLTVSAQRGVVPRKSANVTMFKAESYVGYKLCWPGDLVINSLWAWAHGLGVSLHHGIVSSAYGVYRPLPRANARFIHLLVRSVPFQWELQVRSKGIWVSRLQLTDESFLEAPFPLPPLPEQAAIVRYLDHADRRIRRYVSAKRKLIALLEEEKQAIVNQAVTRGLDPNVRLKPSGVEWLGDVPEHWEVRRLGQVADLATGFPFKSVGFTDAADDIPLLRGVNVAPGRLRWDNVVRWSKDDRGMFAEYEMQPGDIVLGMDRPIIEHGIRVASVTEADVPTLLLQRVARIRPSPELTSAFTFLLLTDRRFADYLEPIFTGISVPHASPEQIRSYQVALPNVQEQAAIVDHVGMISRSIQLTTHSARRQIELLREYRTRLIADVVTGKLDVREAAAQLPDETDDQDPIEESGPLADGMDEALYDIDESAEELAIESEVSA